MSRRKDPHRAEPQPPRMSDSRIDELQALVLDEYTELGPLDREDLRFALCELKTLRRKAEPTGSVCGPAVIMADGVVVATDVQIGESQAA